MWDNSGAHTTLSLSGWADIINCHRLSGLNSKNSLLMVPEDRSLRSERQQDQVLVRNLFCQVAKG